MDAGRCLQACTLATARFDIAHHLVKVLVRRLQVTNWVRNRAGKCRIYFLIRKLSEMMVPAKDHDIQNPIGTTGAQQ